MAKIIERSRAITSISEGFEVHPVVAILGPRQCGKTTLSRLFEKQFNGESHRFDLEDPTDLVKLERPSLALEDLRGLVVIDEIQRQEELFPLLRVLVDKQRTGEVEPAKYLVLGSASRDLIQQSSETLAGRIEHQELSPLSLSNLDFPNNHNHWIRGGFPLSYLAKSDSESDRWRKAYINTFLERDIPNLGINIPAKTLRRFWMMLAHYHGQVVNYSAIARSLDMTNAKVRYYLEILEGTFMIRLLQPWHENIKKRQVKSPKLYFRDSGLLHSLLGIRSHNELLGHPQCGASWEGYCVEEILKAKKEVTETYFWATHQGAELDLLMFEGSKKTGLEIKYSKAPKITKSLNTAIDSLKLSEARIITPGKDQFPLRENISAVGLESFLRTT